MRPAILLALLAGCAADPPPARVVPPRLQVCPDPLPAPIPPPPPHGARQVDAYMRTLIRWGDGNADLVRECGRRLDERNALTQ